MNCNKKCLIYLLSCKTYGLQYLGSTFDPFCYRWNNYKANNRKAGRGVEHMQADLFEHIAYHGHNSFLFIYLFSKKENNTDKYTKQKVN